MIEQHQRICVWAGLAFAPLLVTGLIVAGLFQPPSPQLDAGAIATMYAQDRTSIRIGVWIATAAAPFLAFFVAALSHLLRQIIGGYSPLATAQTIAGSALLLEFIFPQMVWQACAYRVARSPELLQMLNDVAWLCYVGVVGTAIAQMLIIAIVILMDRRANPLVPRWCAFVCIWCALGVSAGSLCVFVTNGPIAWNGIIAWWLLVISFFIWMATMGIQMLRVSKLTEAKLGRLTT
jgi:hypothetical protein